jgi:hypothetical protein
MKLDALLRAHGFMQIERPPELWEAETEDTRLLPLLGEMIAAVLSRGGTLETMILNASNVVFQNEEPDHPEEDRSVPVGEYVALTVVGPDGGEIEGTWRPGHVSTSGLLNRLAERLATAGAEFAYVRTMPPKGTITVWLRRSTPPA